MQDASAAPGKARLLADRARLGCEGKERAVSYRLAAKLTILSLTILGGAAAWLDYSLGWDRRQ